MEFFSRLFASDFMPHGHCYLWRPDILWLNVGSDLIIAAAYFSIPAALYTFVRRRPDAVFPGLFWMFAAFITLCGTTHLIEVWNVWHGAYRIEGVVKFATASVSAATAIALWPLLPRAIALPSPTQLAAANRELEEEIERRQTVEAELLEARADLTIRVEDRTAALRRSMQELERSNRELERFAYVVSHDLKSPLRGISTLAEWIVDDCGDDIDADGKEKLALLSERTDRMHRMIAGILEYSRAGHRSQSARIDSNRLVAEVVDGLVPPPGIRVVVDEGLPELEFDETQLAQVFQNLIDNGIRHLGKPSGEVRVSGRVLPGDEVEFSVSDDGVGIAEQHHERVFRLFQVLQAEPVVGATGVGLAIARKIIESHGGALRLESAPGEGTTFRFTLPKRPPGDAS